MPSEPLSLAEMFPAPQFRERHERLIEAPQAAVWSALHELRLVDLALSHALMDLRSLPARIGRGKRARMVTGRFLEEGPVPVLVSLVNRAAVVGGLLQPWKLFGGAAPPKLDAAGLQASTSRGGSRSAWTSSSSSSSTGAARGCEPRRRWWRPTLALGCCSPGYWLLIRVGSGLIRRDILRAVARRAEAQRSQA